MKSEIQMCFERELPGGPAPSLLSLEHSKEDVMRMLFFNFTSLDFQRQL
jgi:hypothetical protein